MSRRQKGLLIVTLVLSPVLLAGCGKNHTAAEQGCISSDSHVQDPAKEPLSIQKDSEEALRKDIDELGDALVQWFRKDEDQDPVKGLANVVAAPFVPFLMIEYLGKRIQYIEKYGTEEEKKELHEFFAELDKLLKKKE